MSAAGIFTRTSLIVLFAAPAATHSSPRPAIGAAAEHAADGTTPPSDLSGQSDYREHLARVLTKRAVLAAAGS